MRKIAIIFSILAITLYASSGSALIKQLTFFNTPSQYAWSDPSLTGDGKTLYFISKKDLTGNNPNLYSQIFKISVYDGEIEQISNFSEETYCGQLKVSGDNSTLVFRSGAGIDNTKIYVMKTDGTGLFQVSHPTFTVSTPSISWDGEKIVYIAIKGDFWGNDIYIVNNDGTGRQMILQGKSYPVGTYAKISGDGTKIIIATQDNLLGGPTSIYMQLYIMSSDGSDLKQLTNDSEIAWYGPSIPQATYNGDYSLFVSSSDSIGQNPGHRDNLFRIKTDGTEIIQITNAPEYPCAEGIYCAPYQNIISWDGSQVVYAQNGTKCVDGYCTSFIRRKYDGSNIQLLIPAIKGYHNLVDASKNLSVVIFFSNGDFTNENPNGSYELFAYIDDGLWNSGTIKLPQTGQTKCYDTIGMEIDCTGTGQDGEIRAGVAWPSPRFVDKGDGTIIDNLTGLMWAKDAGAPTVGTCIGGTTTWYGALDYVACLNSNSYLGNADWRLANINEIKTLINSGDSDSAIWLESQGFVNVMGFVNGINYAYPSSTSFPRDPSITAMYITLRDGTINIGTKYALSLRAWPVRLGQSFDPDPAYPANTPKTGQSTSSYVGDDGDLTKGVNWPVPRFADNNDGTVTDNLTGLVWLRDANCFGSKTWSQIFLDVNALSNGQCGLTDGSTTRDWRVPNKNEMHSLLDFSTYYPSLPTNHPFINVDNSYWSSTSNMIYTNQAWAINIWDGGSIFSSPKYSMIPVWPVRGGQVNQPPPPPPPSYGNLEVSPSSYDFGEVFVGECDLQLFTLKNSGNADLNISGISLSDTTNFDFDKTIIYACTTDSQTITPGDLCNVVVKFCPSMSGSFNVNLAITSNDPDTPTYNVPITGVAHTMFKFSEPQPPAGSVIKQEMNPLNLLSAAGLIKATVNSGSTYRLNLLQKLLARWNLNPITHSVVICSKGSEIDWTKLQVIINGDDVTSDALTLQYPSSSECDSRGKIILQKYWINGDVDIKVIVYAVDGTVADYGWKFSVETKWLWPMIKDSVKGILLGPLNKVVEILEGIFLPIRGAPD